MPLSRLRRAQDADIDWILAQESRPEFAMFIHSWPRDRHARNLSDCGMAYFLADDVRGHPFGYAILAGLETPARSIELVRILVVEPGRGFGRAMLEAVIDQAFREFGANRLWLDVFDDNQRARRAYKTAGFVEEGTLREAALRQDGTLGSLVIMSILMRDYEPRDIDKSKDGRP